jgi:hypothetical protein
MPLTILPTTGRLAPLSSPVPTSLLVEDRQSTAHHAAVSPSLAPVPSLGQNGHASLSSLHCRGTGAVAVRKGVWLPPLPLEQWTMASVTGSGGSND